MRLSPATRRALSNLLHRREISAGCKRQCDYGGLQGTIASLVRRGLITYGKANGYELTLLGREVITAYERIEWRDSLLTKYERRIYELEEMLEMTMPYLHGDFQRAAQALLRQKVGQPPKGKL
jgi:hypothetical protein